MTHGIEKGLIEHMGEEPYLEGSRVALKLHLSLSKVHLIFF